MPSSFLNSTCQECNYVNQTHLSTKYPGIPLSREPLSSRSDTLLVFQAPGLDEANSGIPVSSIKPNSCGERLSKSFARNGVNRSGFDITEAVCCYPGKDDKKRDKRPLGSVIKCCSHHLEQDIASGNYTKLVTYGSVARDSVDLIRSRNSSLLDGISVSNYRHPSGGLSDTDLDKSYL